DAWKARRSELQQEAHQPVGDEQSDDTTSESKGQAFDEQLTNETGTCGTEGGAHSQFPLAASGAGEKKIGDVHAADEQHESDGGKQNKKSGTDIAGKVRLQGNNAWSPANTRRIIACVLATHLGSKSIEAGLSLFDGHPGLETGDGAGQEIKQTLRR